MGSLSDNWNGNWAPKTLSGSLYINLVNSALADTQKPTKPGVIFVLFTLINRYILRHSHDLVPRQMPFHARVAVAVERWTFYRGIWVHSFIVPGL